MLTVIPFFHTIYYRRKQIVENISYSILGILIPFLGTTLGSAFVFFLRKNMNEKFQKLMVGFAAGVMIAASVWSLILPSVEMSEEQGSIAWFPATVGFGLGIIFLLVINKLAERIEIKNTGKKLNMLLLSVTLHNIPEGMAVGVCFAGFLTGNSGITLLSAMLLSIGIAIQNIPEGAIISMPLKIQGTSQGKAFLYGVLSGIVEPIGAIFTILLTNLIVPILPYLLSFAAGAMVYVVFEELVPEMHSGTKSALGIIGVTFGFTIMMILDIALG